MATVYPMFQRKTRGSQVGGRVPCDGLHQYQCGAGLQPCETLFHSAKALRHRIPVVLDRIPVVLDRQGHATTSACRRAGPYSDNRWFNHDSDPGGRRLHYHHVYNRRSRGPSGRAGTSSGERQSWRTKKSSQKTRHSPVSAGITFFVAPGGRASRRVAWWRLFRDSTHTAATTSGSRNSSSPIALPSTRSTCAAAASRMASVSTFSHSTTMSVTSRGW